MTRSCQAQGPPSRDWWSRGWLAEEFFAVAGSEEEGEPVQVGAESLGVASGAAHEGGEAVGGNPAPGAPGAAAPGAGFSPSTEVR
jgi:hypothetical protein